MKSCVQISGSLATATVILLSGAALLATGGEPSLSQVGLRPANSGRWDVSSGPVAAIDLTYKAEAITAGAEEPIKRAMRPELERLIDRVVVPILVERYIRGLKRNERVDSGAMQ